MKTWKQFNIMAILICIAIIWLALISADPRPTAPEPMSTKTAMHYFRDEGIRIGINLGNTLDAVGFWAKGYYDPNDPIAIETEWGNIPANQAHFNGLRALGFDIVRIPVSWVNNIGPAPNYTILESYLQRVAEVAGYAKNAGLKAFINIHHDGNPGCNGWLDIAEALSSETKRIEIADKYEKVWTQIARYFINYGDWLMFEDYNEIQIDDWDHGVTPEQKYAVINDWNRRFTNAVRGTGGNNTNRYLIYNGYMASDTIAEPNFNLFVLPPDGSNGTSKQIVAFHYYGPFDFVYQVTTHLWGSDHDKAVIDQVFRNFKTKFVDRGIPVLLSENGPFRYANYKRGGGNSGYNAANVAAAKANRLAYVDYLYGRAKENGIVPHFWEGGSSFNAEVEADDKEGDNGLINRNNGQPNSAESAEVIHRMFAAINGTMILPPPQPPLPYPSPVNGNMGNYSYNAQADGITPEYQQAVWIARGQNLTTVKSQSAQLRLTFRESPTAALNLIWQGPSNQIWWKQTNILGDSGNVLNTRSTIWNARTRTLTINLATALADYNSFIAQPTLKLVVQYLGSDNINNLGIVSADIVGRQ